ncbi:MAG: thioredoxin family protein [candidate division Zixibacteria bacterium]|nr:thioredoxin family protein [candidate division Zixibacteria bacterium]
MKVQTRYQNIPAVVLTLLVIMIPLYSVGVTGSVNLDGFSSGSSNADVDPVSVSSVFSYSSAQPGQIYLGAAIADILPNWHINSSTPLEANLIATQLEFDTVPGLTPGRIQYPKAHVLPLLGSEMSVYEGKAVFYYQIKIEDEAPVGEITLPARLTYQSCDNSSCRGPKTEDVSLTFTIGDEGTPINGGIFSGIEIASADESPVTMYQEKSKIQSLIEEHGAWGYVLALGLAFLTGLLLSFSPCTYPMIPITVSVFAGQDRSLGRGFFLALCYVGSMAIVYGIIGLIVSFVGGVFGEWLAYPPVVIGIAVVFVIFSLSMFGLFELNVPNSIRQKLGSTKSGGGVIGSIILGLVAALVVSPCVGPFVGGILVFIANFKSPVFGFLALFSFAMGLGMLYLIIGTFSSAITKLPKAGVWMDQVKKFFGFVLLLMALFFLSNIIDVQMTALLAGLLLLAFAVFGGGFDRLNSEDGFFPRLKKFIGMLAFIGAVYLLLGTLLASGFVFPPASKWLPALGGTGEVRHEKLIDWQTDLESGLAQAKAAGRPVLIDTWATWCKNCEILEEKTFGNAMVAAEAKRFVTLKIQLERANLPEGKAFMETFGLTSYSLPTTLLLDSKGNVKKIMQGVVEPEAMIAEMKKVN